jgi:hypothetical protein
VNTKTPEAALHKESQGVEEWRNDSLTFASSRRILFYFFFSGTWRVKKASHRIKSREEERGFNFAELMQILHNSNSSS